MTDQPARYHRTPADIEAVQWTGTNTGALRAFAGSDFDTIDPEDRIEDPDQDAQLLVEASHWVGIKPGDWVVKYEGYFVAKADATFRAVWEPAAVSVPPSADQTALRDRIAEALYAHNHPGWATRYSDLDQDERDTYLARADAVLAVLPEQTDRAAEFELRGTAEIRAAVLEEAALIAVADNQTCPAVYQCQPCLTRERVAAALLRAAAKDRSAVGEQPETQETRPCDGCGHPAHPSRECPFVRYGERCACDEPVAAP